MLFIFETNLFIFSLSVTLFLFKNNLQYVFINLNTLSSFFSEVGVDGFFLSVIRYSISSIDINLLSLCDSSFCSIFLNFLAF